MTQGDTDKQGTWVNTLLNKEETQQLDTMVEQNGSDRAKFIRWLLKKEWEDRQHLEHGTKNFYKALKGQPRNTGKN